MNRTSGRALKHFQSALPWTAQTTSRAPPKHFQITCSFRYKLYVCVCSLLVAQMITEVLRSNTVRLITKHTRPILESPQIEHSVRTPCLIWKSHADFHSTFCPMINVSAVNKSRHRQTHEKTTWKSWPLICGRFHVGPKGDAAQPGLPA